MMRTRPWVAAACAALVALLGATLLAAQPAQAAAGFQISNGRLVEANGNPFVMRGVSHPHTWYRQQTGAFADIKSLGANAVRVVLSGGRWQANDTADVANVITLCKNNRLICMLENHDTTGYGEQGGAYTLDQAVDYWISVADALAGQENYVLLNIGNEPYGNNDVAAWTQATSNAIGRLRNAGFEHTIVVDAPNWGQDWQFVMRDNAQAVFDSDPDRNVLFSIHMYGVFDTAGEVTGYLDAFQSAGLPLVIGEFGHNHSDGNPDEDTIMAAAVARGIGYIGWSWSGNSGGVEYLDMVNNFDVNSLTSWGQRIFNGADGIASTAVEATIYSGQSPSPTPTMTVSPTPSPTQSPTPTPTPTGGLGCTASYVNINQWPGGFQGEVRITAAGMPISGWTVTWTWADGQSVYQHWNAMVTENGADVAAANLSYNGALNSGASTTFGFLATWNNSTNTDPVPTCVAH